MADKDSRKEKVSRIAKTSFSIGKEISGSAFATIAPATTNTVKSARSVMMDFSRLARRLGARGSAKESESENTSGARKSGALFNKAMSDMSDGTFAVTKANNDMYSDAEDIDASMNPENMKTDDMAELSSEDITLMANRGVSKSIFRATSAQLEGMSGIAQSVMKNQIKTSQALAKSINASIIYGTNVLSSQIMVTNSKLDTVNSNLGKLIEYNSKNTTKFYTESLKMMQGVGKMLDAYSQSMRGSGAVGLGNFNTTSGFDLKGYAKWVKGNYDKSMAKSMTSMFKTAMPSLKDGPAGLMGIVGMAVGELLKATPLGAVSKLDRHVGLYMDEILKQARTKLNDSNSILGQLGIGDLVGNKRRKLEGASLGHYQKDAMPWNGKAQKALTEVIPELLTSIDAGINGTSKRYYDFDKGKFRTRESLEKDYTAAFENMLGVTASKFTSRVDRTIANRGLTDDQLSQIKQAISDNLQNRIYRDSDPAKSRQDLADQLYAAGVDATTTQSLMLEYEDAIKTTIKMMQDYNERISTTESAMRNLLNNSGRTAKDSQTKSYFDTNIRTINKDIFDGGFSADANQLIKMITEEMSKIYKGYSMDRNTKQKIIDMMNHGESDAEILREIKNQYAVKNLSSNAMGFANKKVRGLMDKWRPKVDEKGRTRVQAYEEKQAARRARKVSGEYNQDSKFERAVERIDSDIGRKVMGYTYGPAPSTTQTRRATGDTRLQNRQASSQRSEMNGVAAGASYAHAAPSAATSTNESSYLSNETERAIDDITDAAMNPVDLNATDDQLDRQARIQQRAMSATQQLADQAENGVVSEKSFLASVQMAIGSMMTSFTNFTTRLVGKNGFLNKITESPFFKETMGKFKDFLFNEETGLFKDQIKAAKSYGKDLWGKTKDELSKGYDWIYRMYYTGKYGEDYESDERWQNNKIAQKMNFRKRYLDAQKKAADQKESGETEINPEPESTATERRALPSRGDTARLALPPTRLSLPGTSGPVDDNTTQLTPPGKPEAPKKDTKLALPGVNGTQSDETDKERTDLYLKLGGRKAIGMSYSEWKREGFPGIESLPLQAAEEAAEVITTSTHKLNETLVGDDKTDVKKKMQDGMKSIQNDIKKKGIIPKAGAAAITGGLVSLFTPMGLIGGAISAAGISILSHTEAFKSILFGKLEENGERSGGLLKKEFVDEMKKAAPDVVKMGVTGAAASGALGLLGMSFLPGGIVGGAIIGMGTALIKNNKSFMDLLFGKEEVDENGNPTGRRSGKMLSNAFNKMNKAMQGTSSYLKAGVKGLGIGAVTGATLSAMGVLPGAFAAGPIGLGIAGLGLGIASATKGFNEWLFGTEEIDPETGKPTGKRTGGILTKVRNLLMVNFVQPIADSFKNNIMELFNWTKQKLFEPFRLAFGPIIDSLRDIKDNVTEFVKDKFEKLGEGIKNAIEGTIKTIFSPVGKLVRGVGKSVMGAMRLGLQAIMSPAALALKGVQTLTSGKRRKEEKEFRKAYRPHLSEMLNAKWDADAQDDKDGKRPGLFSRMADRFDAYVLGQGDVVDAAREGYNAALGEDGQNTFDWRNVKVDKKKRKSDIKDWRKSYKTWQRVDKYSRQIANKELHGSDAELNERQFKRYKKKFVDLGIDEDLLQTSDDILELIYDRRKFKERAAKDRTKTGEFEALSAFRETDEQIKAREETSKYQTNVEKLLGDIVEQFKYIGDDRADAIYDSRENKVQQEARDRAFKNRKRLIKNANRINDTEAAMYWGQIEFDDPRFKDIDLTELSFDDMSSFMDEYILSDNKLDPTTAFYAWCFSHDNMRRWRRTRLRKKRYDREKSKYQALPPVGQHAADLADQAADEGEAMLDDMYNNGLIKERRATSTANNTNVPEGSLDSINFEDDSTNANQTSEILKKWGNGQTSATSAVSNDNDLISSINEIKANVKAQTALQSGGEIDADDVSKKSGKTSWLSRIGKKFSTNGFFGNLFNRKAKADAKAAKAAKESAENAEATALGDENGNGSSESGDTVNVTVEGEKEEKQSIFSKIFSKVGGVFSSIFGAIGNTKIGSVLGKVAKIGGLAVLGGGIGSLALGIMEAVSPGSTDGITAKINGIKDDIKSGNFVDTIFSLISKGIEKIGDVITKYGPDLITNHIGPAVVKGFQFLADNASLIANMASQVVTTLVPALAEALFKVIPALLTSFWDSTIGSKFPSLKFNKDENNGTATVEGSQFADSSATSDFVDELNENGVAEYVGSDGKTHKMYKSKKGEASINEETGAVEVTGTDAYGNKLDTNALSTSIIGGAGRAAINIAKGGTAAKIGKATLSTIGAAAGTIPGSAIGTGLGLKTGVSGALTGSVTGAVSGAKKGSKVANAVSTGISSASKGIANSGFKNAFSQQIVSGNGITNIPIVGKLFGNSKNQQQLLNNVTNSLINNTNISNETLAIALKDGASDVIDDTAARALIEESVSKQVTEAMAEANVKGMSEKSIKDAVEKATNSLIKENGDDAVEAATKLASGTAARVTSEIGESATDIAKSGKKGFMQKFFDKVKSVIDKLADNDTVKSIIAKFSNSKAGNLIKKFVDGFKSVVDKVASKVFADENIWMKYANKVQSALAKMGLNVTPIGVLTATYDIANGAFNAPALFNVRSQSEVDWLMRLISALMEFVFGLLSFLDIIIEIAGAVMGKDFKCMLATTLYKWMAPDDGGWGLVGDTALENSQIAMEIATKKYNESHGTDLTAAELNDKTNLSLGGWVLNGGKWLINKVTNAVTGGNGTNFETAGSVKAEMDEVSDEEIAAYKASNGSWYGEGVGYGLGPVMASKTSKNSGVSTEAYYKQGNAIWANQKLGTFANGETATMSNAGCGPTAMAMAVKEITGMEVSPSDMGTYAVNNGFITNGGANEGLFTKGAASFGLSSTKVDRKHLKDALKTNIPTIVSGSGGSGSPYTDAGHVVVVRGLDSSGKTTVEDPMTGKAKKYSANSVAAGYNKGWLYGRAGVVNRSTLNTRAAAGYGIAAASATNEDFAPNNFRPDNYWDPDDAVALLGTEYATTAGKNCELRKISDIPDTELIMFNHEALQRFETHHITTLSTSDSEFRKLCYQYAIKPADAIDYIRKQRWYLGAYKYSKTSVVPSDAYKNPYALYSIGDLQMEKYANQKVDTSTKPLSIGDLQMEKYANQKVDTSVDTSSDSSDYDIASDSSYITIGESGWTKDRVFSYINSAPNFFQKIVRIGKLLQAMVNSISNGTTIWEEYGKLITSSSSDDDTSEELASLTIAEGDEEPFVWNYLRNKGYSTGAAAGLMGCWQHESTNTPYNLEASYLPQFLTWTGKSTRREGIDYVMENDTNRDRYVKDFLFKQYDKEGKDINKDGYLHNGHYYPGFGIAQWTGGRTLNLWTFAKTKNEKPTGMDTQLAFFDEEMEGSYRNSTKNKLSNVGTDYDTAAEIVYKYYESGGHDLPSGDIRRKYAKEMFDKYQNMAVTPPQLYASLHDDSESESEESETGNTTSTEPTDEDYALGHDVRLASSSSGSSTNAALTIEEKTNFFSDYLSGTKLDDMKASVADSAFVALCNKYSITPSDGVSYISRRLNNVSDANLTIYKTSEGNGSGPRINYASPIGYGLGSVGYGPEDASNSFTPMYQGMSNVANVITDKLAEVTGINLNDTSEEDGSTDDSTKSTTSLRTDANASKTQQALVNQMKSVEGTLKYSLDGDKQDPDKGYGSCASTVSWAYRKVFKDVDNFASNRMSASSNDSSKDSRFTTIYEKTDKNQKLDTSILAPGDVMYQHWKGATGYTGVYNKDHMSHTEMWAGDNKAWSHGSSKVLGPTLKIYKDYGDSETTYNRIRDTMRVRRYNGFVGYGNGPSERRKRVDSVLRNAQHRDASREKRALEAAKVSVNNLRNKVFGFGSGADTTTTEVISNVGVEDRLDKIFDLITQWYLSAKDAASNNTNNMTVIDASKKVVAQTPKSESTEESPIKSKLEVLANKHKLFAAV